MSYGYLLAKDEGQVFRQFTIPLQSQPLMDSNWINIGEGKQRRGEQDSNSDFQGRVININLKEKEV
jgi:hypothetical protein